MHELSIAQAIIDQVESVARREKGRAVAVTVRMGCFAGVDREALEFAFPLAAEAAELPDLRLTLREVPADLRCGACGKDTTGTTIEADCPQCGRREWTVSGGRDLQIETVELAVP